MNSPSGDLTPTIPDGLSIFEIAFFIFLGLVLLVLIFLGYRLFGGMSKLEESEEEAASDFEKRLLAEIGQTSASDRPAPEPPTAPEPNLPPPVQNIEKSNVVASNDPGDIAKRLQALQVITDREGKVPLSYPPDGLIYRLQIGGSCLILPRQESEQAMHHFARRFDMVIFPGQDGDLLLMERFQSRLPSLMKQDRPGLGFGGKTG